MVSKHKQRVNGIIYSKKINHLNSEIFRLHQGILIDEIKQVSTTKKALWSLEDKKYTFLASSFVTKELMKRAIETCFNVRVIKVNTSNLPTKKKRVGKYIGVKAKLKKVIITLNPNDEIPLFSDI